MEESYDGARLMVKDFYSALQWSEIEQAYNFAAFKTGEPFKRVINRDNLLDMFCQGKLL